MGEIILLIIIYLILLSIGPHITNKLNLSNKIYLNKQFTKFKSKYQGILLLVIVIVNLLINYNILSTVEGYILSVQSVVLILFAFLLIIRDSLLNKKYIPVTDDVDKYFLDFTKSAFIPLFIAIGLTYFLINQLSLTFTVILMIVFVIEVIIMILATFPDKLYEYFKLNNYNFTYVKNYYIILLISIIPTIILILILIILSYI